MTLHKPVQPKQVISVAPSSTLQRVCQFCFCGGLLISLVNFNLESSGDLSWQDLVGEPKDLSDCEPENRLEGVPDVIDVLVSPFGDH